MGFLHLLMFAQVNAEELQITSGQALSASLVGLVMIASLVMNVVWILRWQRNEEFLPASPLGLLRVPPILTLVALILATLILSLILTNAIVPVESLPAEMDADAETAVELTEEQAAEGDRRTIQTALRETFLFDIALLVVMGGVVWSASRQGRVMEVSDAVTFETDPDIGQTADFVDPVLSLPSAPVRNQEPYGILTELRFAAEVFLVAYLPTAVLKLTLTFLVPLITGRGTASHPFLEMLGQGVDWTIFAQLAIMAALIAPVVEELFYRVVILGGLAQLGSMKFGLVVSSIVFCFAHGFPDSLALIPLAFVLGYTYIQRRSYLTVVLVHFLFNSFNLLVAGLAIPGVVD